MGPLSAREQRRLEPPSAKRLRSLRAARNLRPRGQASRPVVVHEPEQCELRWGAGREGNGRQIGTDPRLFERACDSALDPS
eukprot:9469857-Pyramimonas_sp.AAC.1